MGVGRREGTSLGEELRLEDGARKEFADAVAEGVLLLDESSTVGRGLGGLATGASVSTKSSSRTPIGFRNKKDGDSDGILDGSSLIGDCVMGTSANVTGALISANDAASDGGFDGTADAGSDGVCDSVPDGIPDSTVDGVSDGTTDCISGGRFDGVLDGR